ncbi:glycosyltransferase [Gluconobacter japonicus]|uniref:glycosyltransferase n=1 Tax=Gluconobacter japonicus TaxID=376620 RepID=UPI001B8CF1C2|nr:glycosyltransferase [Gluconobacter japonicus]MBS1050102.1 glycosyltransferase [Gluconobacter japonicus]
MPVSSSDMSVCVVTVTYGQRAHLLDQVLTASFACGVVRAVVVDNGSPADNQAALTALQDKFGTDRLHLVRLEENTGSAGGFHAALAHARTLLDIRFLWILDDDTVPQPSTLSSLENTWRAFGSTDNTALMCFREDRRVYQKALARKTLHGIEPDAFFDFNLAHLWNGGKRRARMEHGCLELESAAYGGLWLARSWLDRIALPPAHFHLYFDDYAFSLQIPEHGGQIWLCPDSPLRDIETSWQADRKTAHPWLTLATEDRRVFCTIRNRLWIERPRIRRPWLHTVNMVLYFLIKVLGTSLRYMLANIQKTPCFLRRFHLIWRALQQGRSSPLT